MQSIEHNINQVAVNINTILTSYANLERAYVKLVEERQELQDKVNGLQMQLNELQNQHKMTALALKASGGKQEQQELKKTLDKMIRETNQCIKLLSS